MWLDCNIEQQGYIYVGRADGQPLSDVVALTCNLPLIAAGCNTLHMMIDKMNDQSICADTEDWFSCASEALLQDRTVHVMTLKHVLATVSQLVSLSLIWPVAFVEIIVVITAYVCVCVCVCVCVLIYLCVCVRVCASWTLLPLLSSHADRQGVHISFTVCLFVCMVTDFSAEDKASSVTYCTAVRRRPRHGISHFWELCSLPQKPIIIRIGQHAGHKHWMKGVACTLADLSSTRGYTDPHVNITVEMEYRTVCGRRIGMCG